LYSDQATVVINWLVVIQPSMALNAPKMGITSW